MPVFEAARLEELITEYGQLRRLEGHTPQSRGRRLNEVVAEMLRCWGIEARTSIRSPGEIDVGFAVGGIRYVLEAKWERTKADTGRVAKLQKRVRQRLAGTYGIFLSMSGYSREALTDVALGERLEVLLLDASHFEAMLAGLVPPEEMLSLLHDRAAYNGEAHSPLSTLLASTVGPELAFGRRDEDSPRLLRSALPNVTAELLLTVADSNQIGLASVNRNELLVTTQHGVAAVDLAKEIASWAVPVSGCHRNPVVDCDGAAFFTRRHGVGRYQGGQVTVVGGGFAGASWLMRHPGGSVWTFDNGTPGNSARATVTRLGHQLGDEQRIVHDYPPATAANSCWLNDKEVLTIGNPGLSISAPGRPSRWLRLPQANPMGLARLTVTSVLTGGDAVRLLCTSLDTGHSLAVAELDLRGSVNELAVGADGSIYLAAYRGPAGGRVPFVVMRIHASLEIDSMAMRSASTPVLRVAGPAASQTAADGPSPPAPPATVFATPSLPSEAMRSPTIGLQVSRRDRGNPSGEYVAFHGYSGIYWLIVGINCLLMMALGIIILASDASILTRVIMGAIETFLVFVTWGFAKMAAAPVRLEVGSHGVQVFARSDTSWFPWQIIDRVEVMRLEGGGPHIVVWCAGANMFPEFDNYGGGPRFLPRLGSVAICPINVLRARRHLIVRTLHTYGGNRVGTL